VDDRNSLTLTLRLRGRSVVFVGQGPAADEQRRALERAGARIVGEGSKAVIAVVVDDPAAVSRMKVRGLLVYAVGQPDLSDVILTKTLDRPQSNKAGRVAPSQGASAAIDIDDMAIAPVAAMKAPAAEVTRSGTSEAHAPSVPDPATVTPLDAAAEIEREVRKRVKIRTRVRTDKLAKPPKPVKPPKPAKPPKLPREKVPSEGPGMIQRIMAGILHVVRAIVAFAAMVARPCLRLPLFLLRPFMAVPVIISSAIRTRLERSRETPLALSLALAKGGPLDPLAGDDRPRSEEADAPNALPPTASEPSPAI
jgi:hypothetical protein